jgi:hypothetical protein
VNRDTHRLWRAGVVAALCGTACVVAAQSLGAFGSGTGPPKPAITGGPISATVATSATFSFAGLAPAFDCSLDGAGFRPCTSPVTYRRLGLGDHTFKVRGRDAAGETGDSASYSWKIVAAKASPTGTVPRPLFITVPVKPWLSRTATFAWDRRGAPSSQCALDRSKWTACRSPRTYERLTVGAHVFSIRGVNGSRHSSVNQFYWTIAPATPPPPPILTGAPDANTTSTTAVLAFDGDGDVEFECSLDAGDWQTCASPVIYVGLALGPHTFCVRSLLPIGIPSTPTCTSWSISAPDQPAAPSPPAPGFTITGDQPAVLAPGLGGPVPVTITNPQSFPITVTDLVVTVAAGGSNSGCDGATNLSVAQSNMAGGAVSVVVPAGGSVVLPAQGATAPVVTMLDSASNQDACKGAVFTLDYAATGTG